MVTACSTRPKHAYARDISLAERRPPPCSPSRAMRSFSNTSVSAKHVAAGSGCVVHGTTWQGPAAFRDRWTFSICAATSSRSCNAWILKSERAIVLESLASCVLRPAGCAPFTAALPFLIVLDFFLTLRYALIDRTRLIWNLASTRPKASPLK